MARYIIDIFYNFLVPIVTLLIASLIYFKYGKEEKLILRIIKSSHGILVSIAYIYAVLIAQCPLIEISTPVIAIYFSFFLLAGFSVIFSLFDYIDWRFHLLYLIEVPLSAVVFMWGLLWMSHDSI